MASTSMKENVFIINTSTWYEVQDDPLLLVPKPIELLKASSLLYFSTVLGKERWGLSLVRYSTLYDYTYTYTYFVLLIVVLELHTSTEKVLILSK